MSATPRSPPLDPTAAIHLSCCPHHFFAQVSRSALRCDLSAAAVGAVVVVFAVAVVVVFAVVVFAVAVVVAFFVVVFAVAVVVLWCSFVLLVPFRCMQSVL